MGSTSKLSLQVILQMFDRASGPMRGLGRQSRETAGALRSTRDELKRLKDQQGVVDSFNKIKAASLSVADRLSGARQRVIALGEAHRTGSVDAKTYAEQLAAEEKTVQRLTRAQDAHLKRLWESHRKLKELGISDAGYQSQLPSLIASASGREAEQRARLEALAATQKRASNMAQAGQSMALRGGMMLASGVMTSRSIGHPIAEAKKLLTEERRIAALGLGEKISRDAVDYARAMKTYGTSTTDNIGLMRDAIAVFGDLHHAMVVAPTLAKMKFANEAMFGDEQAADNSRKFMDMLKVIELRGGLASKEKFGEQANVIQRIITATGGRVQAEQWLDLIKTGGVAAKGMSDKAMYYQLEPLVQEMGGHRVGTAIMSAYQNIYQGRTTTRAARQMQALGLIGDPSKVQYDKSGQIAHLSVGALKGSELFRENQFEWMNTVLVPALAAKGITSQRKIIDTIGGIFSNRTASNLFAQMYMQRDQIAKNARLNAGADGVDQLYDKARGTPQGTEIDALSKRADLYARLGNSIMPTYTMALELAAGAFERLAAFTAAYPGLTKAMIVGLGLIAGAMVLIGGAFVTMGPALIGLAWFVRNGATMRLVALGIAGGIRAISAALIGNPIGLGITLIATAIATLAANWDDVTKAASGTWKALKERFPWIEKVSRFFGIGSDQPSAPAPTPRIDRRDPLPSWAIRAPATPSVVHVHPSAGMDERSLAAEVVRRMDERDRALAARQRSALVDY